MKMTDLVSLILRYCPARLGLVVTVILTSLSTIAPEAQARIRVTTAPEPPSSTATGGSPQKVEGFETLGNPSDPNDNFTFNIRGDLTVSGTDGLPNPNNVIGTGNLLDVVQAAADVWDTAFPDLPDIDIGVGWADFGEEYLISTAIPLVGDNSLTTIEIDGIVAFYIPAQEYPENLSAFPDNFTIGSFPSDGLILFNSQLQDVRRIGTSNTRSIKLFLDGDLTPDSQGNYPNSDSAFGPLDQFDRSSTDRDFGLTLGSEAINVERSSVGDFSDYPDADDAFVIDLFTVALHELQHAFGLTRANPVATNKINNGILTAGDFQIPTTFIEEGDDVHISLRAGTDSIRTPVADAFVTFGERKCPTGVDIVATAEVAGQTNFDLNPCKTLVTEAPQPEPEPVPEPSAIGALLAIGAGGLLRGRKLLKSRTTR